MAGWGVSKSAAANRQAEVSPRNNRLGSDYRKTGLRKCRICVLLGRPVSHQWDAKAFGQHKIHSKLVIVDPWGDRPALLVGSSNHSDESCRKNDENNILIRGDRRIIAVMTTEFMRMFDHYKSRDFINSIQRGTAADDDKYLKETVEDWARTSFDPQARSHKFRDREVFSGKT